MNQSSQSAGQPANDRPILSEAKRKSLIGLVGSIVAALVAFGFMSPELAEKISSGWAWALGAIVTALPMVTSVLHALGIVKGAERKTTPVDSPQAMNGEPLVPLSAAGLDEPGKDTEDDQDGGGDEEAEPEIPDDEEDLDEAEPEVIPDEDAAVPGRHSQTAMETTGSLPSAQ